MVSHGRKRKAGLTLQELILPRIKNTRTQGNFASYDIEPLEAGYGMTLGNSLRRVLLSSLPGAAVTSIRIDGVQHEFQDIPSVMEDVTDIVLNIKQLALRMHGDDLTLELQATGAELKLEPWDGDVFTLRLMPSGRFAAAVQNMGDLPNGFAQFQMDSEGKPALLCLSFDGQIHELNPDTGSAAPEGSAPAPAAGTLNRGAPIPAPSGEGRPAGPGWGKRTPPGWPSASPIDA